MPNFKTATAFLLLLSNFAAAQLPGDGENCASIEQLGTPNLDRFDFSVSMVSTPFSLIFLLETEILSSICLNFFFFLLSSNYKGRRYQL